MTGIHNDLLTSIDAVTILSSTTYMVNGEPRRAPERRFCDCGHD